MSSARLQINLRPEVLRWARQRAGLGTLDLARKVGVRPARVEEWEESGRISFAQADKLARHTYTPLGFLYLPEPVEEPLPIPDFRAVRDEPLEGPSPDLLETIQAMQRRQAWMRDERREQRPRAAGFRRQCRARRRHENGCPAGPNRSGPQRGLDSRRALLE